MAYDEIRVGDRIRFDPQQRRAWWLVRARNSRYIVATRQAAFHPRGTLEYTVVDLEWPGERVPAGMARSSLNQIGGGWGNGSYDDEQCAEILMAITFGGWQLSHRRIITVANIEHRVGEA